MRFALMFVLTAGVGCAQFAQNMEIIFMAGGVSTSRYFVPGSSETISGSVGFVTQIGYAYQFKTTSAGNLWLEIPMTWTWQGTGTVTGTTVASIGRNDWFFTPGVRYKTLTFGRVSFYASAGGGFGWFSKLSTTITGANGTVIDGFVVHFEPVFDFAGGADLRLSRRLSLRAEGRDFVTQANLGGVAGHNHPVFLVGIAFHF